MNEVFDWLTKLVKGEGDGKLKDINFNVVIPGPLPTDPISTFMGEGNAAKEWSD